MKDLKLPQLHFLLWIWTTCYIELSYINIILKRNPNLNTLTVLFEKSETVSFASSVMKNIVESSGLTRLLLKLICWIAFGSVSIIFSLLKSIAISL